jgi:murein DD-endopeptidase MepM/ murein hydrolase activator NlpD
MKKRSKLRIALAALVIGYAATWVDYALASPIAVPVDGVTPARVPNGFRGAIHEGVDIFAKKGTPVRAVTSGVVVRRETQRRGGNVVFVLGSNAVMYFYAHLDRWADADVGRIVTAGTILGWVGDTGNAKGRA